ncbi:MAG: hypothetical protein WC612_05360 [Bdellovibrionales bacterium]|jgi:septal ring factor EnvC (AmiA/AmiB activator)
MSLWGLVFVISTGAAACAFVVVAVLWLKKLRETLAVTLGETASQQIKTAQRLSDTLASLERQQQRYEQRLETLTEASLRMRQDINHLDGRLEMTERDLNPSSTPRLLH